MGIIIPTLQIIKLRLKEVNLPRLTPTVIYRARIRARTEGLQVCCHCCLQLLPSDSSSQRSWIWETTNPTLLPHLKSTCDSGIHAESVTHCGHPKLCSTLLQGAGGGSEAGASGSRSAPRSGTAVSMQCLVYCFQQVCISSPLTGGVRLRNPERMVFLKHSWSRLLCLFK